MPKFLSELVKKVPPFRYIHSKLEELDKETSELNNQTTQLKVNLENTTQRLKNAENENYKLTQDLQSALDLIRSLESMQGDLIKKLDQFSKAQKDQFTQIQEVQESVQKNYSKQNEQFRSLQNEDKNIHRRLDSTKNALSKDITYHYYKGLHPDQYAENLKEWYYWKTGKKLNLEHPKTYNEKIQWLKLYDSTPLKTRLSDKYAVREWVADKIGKQYLVPLLGVYDRFDDIDFDALPDRFVIKTNHASGVNWIVKDKHDFNKAEAKAFFDIRMQRNFAFWNGFELQYKGIEPKIIIEEYLENEENNISDYKIFCFDGVANCIMFMKDRETEVKRAFYDREWNLMPCVNNLPRLDEIIEKPDNLDEMLELAETLSKGFYHVRVDFYRLNTGELKFGEMTFSTASGLCHWDPEEYDRIFGGYIKLPIDEDNLS